MIIAFSGKMGSGKSTAVESLKFRLSEKVSLVKLAQPLYDMQEFIYRRISSVHSRAEGFIKDRKLLQFLGTEWGRDEISKTIWTDIWKDAALEKEGAGHLVVCDDLRYDNEAEFMKSLGAIIVKIERNSVEPRSDYKNTNHPSEMGIDAKYIDYVVQNNGTKNEYNTTLTNLFNKILQPMSAQK